VNVLEKILLTFCNEVQIPEDTQVAKVGYLIILKMKVVCCVNSVIDTF